MIFGDPDDNSAGAFSPLMRVLAQSQPADAPSAQAETVGGNDPLPGDALVQFIAQRASAPQQGASAAQINRFFNVLDSPLSELAQGLGLPPHYLLGLAAYESGYYDDHNRDLLNPLGLTRGGGSNLGFKRLDDALAVWRQLYGDQARGAASPEDFAQRLLGQRDGQVVPGWRAYNTANPNWAAEMRNTINSIGAREQRWKDAQNFDR